MRKKEKARTINNQVKAIHLEKQEKQEIFPHGCVSHITVYHPSSTYVFFWLSIMFHIAHKGRILQKESIPTSWLGLKASYLI